MITAALWGLSAGLVLDLGLCALALWYGARSRRAAAAKARRVAMAVARREIDGYWRSLERELAETNARIDLLAQIKPALRIAKDDAA